METGKCLLCGMETEIAHENRTGAAIYKCRKCGKYMVSEEMMDDMANLMLEEDKPYLSCYANRYLKENGQPLLITPKTYRIILNRAKAAD